MLILTFIMNDAEKTEKSKKKNEGDEESGNKEAPKESDPLIQKA